MFRQFGFGKFVGTWRATSDWLKFCNIIFLKYNYLHFCNNKEIVLRYSSLCF